MWLIVADEPADAGAPAGPTTAAAGPRPRRWRRVAAARVADPAGGSRLALGHGGVVWSPAALVPAAATATTTAGPPAATLGPLRAPMAGRLREVLVAVGDRVEAGQPLVAVEAMKMESWVVAPAAARVVSLAGRVGDAVEPGAVLVVLGPS